VGLLSALIAALVTGGLFLAFGRDRATSSASPSSNSRLANGKSLDIGALLTKAQPSVVAIQTGQASSRGVFGGAGTGVIISEDGLVLTNSHVISGANSMKVTLFDGEVKDAELVGSSPSDDIALVKLRDASGLVPAELGSSADARVGDDVVAIGNALNLGGPPSVTEGIISAKDRTIQAPSETLKNLLQTDAAINPGNSGGPLLNAQGQVIGINTAIISDAQNIGFAIPIDIVKPLIDQLKAGKGAITPDSAFLGVVTSAIADLNTEVLDQYNITASDGAVIVDLVPGSAAADAGLQIGDVITSIDGQKMSSSEQVVAAIRAKEAGDKVTIDVERNGKKQSVTVTLKSRRDSGN